MTDESDVEMVRRGCDTQGICNIPGATCCTGELCNVGSEVDNDEDENDDVEPSTYLPRISGICPYSQKPIRVA